MQSQSGDWEGLFIDGKLIDEAHTLGEGYSRLYLWRMGIKYGFLPDDIRFLCVNDVDEQYLYDYGNFPSNINDLDGKYQQL